MSNEANVGKVFNLTGGGGGGGALNLEGLAISRPPTKTRYKSGETFDPTGMVVTALYAYGITSEVTGYTVSPNVLTDGTTAVTITYTEGRITKSALTPVIVDKVLTSIEVTNPPTKTEYNYLEAFDPAGMVVTAHFSDNSSTAVTGYNYSATGLSTLGSQPVGISYTYEGVTKSTTQAVTVNPITLPIPTQKNIPTYDGNSKIPEWDDYDSGKMSVSGDTSGILAKTDYAITFTLSYGYQFTGGSSTATVNWSIDRAVIEKLPTQVNIPAYDGGVKSPEWDGYDPAKMAISGDQYGTDVQEYTSVFTPNSNYKWWDGTTTAKNATWQIVSVLVSIPTQKNIPTYDGTSKTPEWDDFDTAHSTVSVSPASAAGTHSAVFSLISGQWTDGTTAPKTINWIINRDEITVAPKQSGTLTYDGTAKSPTWDSGYDDSKMTLDVTAQVNAGENFEARFTPDSNHCWAEALVDDDMADNLSAKTIRWAINRAARTIPAPTGTASLYNVELDAVAPNAGGNDGTIEYACNTSNSAPESGWQTSTSFTGLNRATAYYFFARVKDGSNYLDATSGGSLITTLDRTALTITGIVSGKVYDGQAITAPDSVTAMNGATPVTGLSFVYTRYAGNQNTPMAGTPKKAGDYRLVISIADDDLYYTGQSSEISFSITAKPVTIINLSASDKVYDGGTTATPTGDATVNGAVSGDDISVSPGSASFGDKNVGTGKTVTFTGYSLSGDDADNYSLTAQPASVTASITQRDITVSGITAGSKAYDGGTTAALNTSGVTLTGKVNGDTLTVSATGAFTDANVGNNKTVNISNLALNGTDAGNYKLAATGQQSTATANITQATGTMTGVPTDGVTLKSDVLTYDFTIGGDFDGSYSVVSSDSSIATVSLVSGKTYRISHVSQTTGTATIIITPTGGTNYTRPAAQTIPVSAQFVTIWGVEFDWTSGGPTNGVRTDAAVGLADPVPAVKNGSGSSPFDAFEPWAGMVKETRSGGVMVKEPKYWFKWTKTGKKLKLQIANGPVEGFHVDPVNMDKGDGLGELDFSYIGRYHCASDWKSTTGVAQHCDITRSAARSGIHGLGANFWQIDFAQMWYVGMLYLVEFADWNGQAKIGYGCSASGSKENNGKTDAMQYHTGTTAANRTTYGYTQYRNIEGWWDNVYDWMDGCYYNSNGLNVILNPNNFSDSSGGTLVGKPSSGYPSDLAVPTQSGLEWAVYPTEANGSDSSHVPDDWYYNALYPCLFHGGYYSQSQNHGPFYVYYNSATFKNAGIGCRLQERPPKAA